MILKRGSTKRSSNIIKNIENTRCTVQTIIHSRHEIKIFSILVLFVLVIDRKLLQSL